MKRQEINHLLITQVIQVPRYSLWCRVSWWDGNRGCRKAAHSSSASRGERVSSFSESERDPVYLIMVGLETETLTRAKEAEDDTIHQAFGEKWQFNRMTWNGLPSQADINFLIMYQMFQRESCRHFPLLQEEARSRRPMHISWNCDIIQYSNRKTEKDQHLKMWWPCDHRGNESLMWATTWVDHPCLAL